MSLIAQINETIQDVQNQLDELEQTKSRIEDELLKKQEALDAVDETIKTATKEVKKWCDLLEIYSAELQAKTEAAKQYMLGITDDIHRRDFMDFMKTQDVDLYRDRKELTESDHADSTPDPET